MIRLRASVTLACALTALSASTASATPVPRVTGPLPVSAASYPFGAADHQLQPQDLRKVGYVEEEFLASGQANVYSWPAPGPAVVRTPRRAVHDALSRASPGQGVALQRQRRGRDPQPVEPLRPQHRLGARAPRADPQRRRVGRRHRQARRGRRAQDVRSRPVRGRSRSRTRCRSTTRATAIRRSRSSPGLGHARHGGRPGLRHHQPGRGVGAQPRALEPAHLRQAPYLAGGARLQLRLLADRQLPVRLHQRDPAARRAVRRPADVRRLHRRGRRRSLHRRGADEPVRGAAAATATRASSSTTSVRRSSTSCPSRTT